MIVELKEIHCPAIDDLEAFHPSGDFGIYIQALIGPKAEAGEESFGMFVCTPNWFADNRLNKISSGCHFVFMEAFDFQMLKSFLEDFCARCIGRDWREVTTKLRQLGEWEFEDYRK